MSPLIATRAGASARGFGWSLAAGAPAGAFESIATVTASGGETSLSFTNIPQTYAALQIRGIARTTYASTGSTTLRMRVNSDTGTNYMTHYLNGDGSTSVANSQGPGVTSADWMGRAPHSNVGSWGATIIDLHDYTSTTKRKTIRACGGADGNAAVTNNYMVVLSSGLWLSTAAVTNVALDMSGFVFDAGSTFALYGIKGAA